jgi:quercetin dioxygenase-like cupin family protein
MTAAALKALRDVLLAEFARPVAGDPAAAREVAAVIALAAAAAPEPVAFEATPHPATRHLETALVAVESHAPALAAALRPLGEVLPWRYGYAPRADAPGLELRMAWAELIGPAAPFRSAQVGLGVTLIGPHTFYPPHRHPAVEVYRVVAGTAEWSADGNGAARPPGSVILHRANVVHAMRTAEQPLLALYSWSGDVDSPSVWEEYA